MFSTIKNFRGLHFENVEHETNEYFIIKDELLFEKANGILKNKQKRIIDIILSLFCILFLFSFIFPIVAIIIKLTSKGPIFFVQNRIGLNNKVFKCFKFRTMYMNGASNFFTPVSYSDKRITPIGSFLRKSNLDELPQILNVLMGEMSLVGPRPHAIPFHNEYSEFIENIDYRHLVKPGITGLAQIHGFRGDVADPQHNVRRTKMRIFYDINYIRTHSTRKDFKIILITVYQMISRTSNGF